MTISETPPHRVFVYGAMRVGCHSNDALADALYMGVAHYPNGHSKMVDLGTSPGLVPDEDGPTIRGELYGVSHKLFAKLDAVAAGDTLNKMVRRKVTVWLGTPEEGGHFRAWCYFIKDTGSLKYRTPCVPFQPDDWYVPVADWVAHRRLKAKHLMELVKAGARGDRVSEYWPHNRGVGGDYKEGNWSPTVYTGSASNYVKTPGPREPDPSKEGYRGKYPELLKLAPTETATVTTPTGRVVTFLRTHNELMEVSSKDAPIPPEPKLEGLSEDWVPPPEPVEVRSGVKDATSEFYGDYEDYTVGEDYVMNLDTGKWEPRPPLVAQPPVMTETQKEIAATFLAAWAKANACAPHEDDEDDEASYCG